MAGGTFNYAQDQQKSDPHILSMMKWCDERKFPYVIVPVGDSAATFSGEDQELTRWLVEKGKKARVSRIVPPPPTP